MDRHEFEKITAEDIAAAHLKNLEVHQTAFWLVTGRDLASVESAHRESLA